MGSHAPVSTEMVCLTACAVYLPDSLEFLGQRVLPFGPAVAGALNRRLSYEIILSEDNCLSVTWLAARLQLQFRLIFACVSTVF